MLDGRQGAQAVAARVCAVVRDHVRRSPVTSGYLLLLAAADVVVFHLLTAATRARLLQAISTNVHNLGRHPMRSLAASMLVADTRASFLDELLIVGLGVAVCLAWLERRAGSVRAAGVFVLGHVAATLVAALVIVTAVRGGVYPPSVERSRRAVPSNSPASVTVTTRPGVASNGPTTSDAALCPASGAGAGAGEAAAVLGAPHNRLRNNAVPYGVCDNDARPACAPPLLYGAAGNDPARPGPDLRRARQ